MVAASMSLMPFKSPPALKVSPAPVSTTALIDGSCWIRRVTAPSSSRMVGLIALRLAGRARVIFATPSSTTTSKASNGIAANVMSMFPKKSALAIRRTWHQCF